MSWLWPWALAGAAALPVLLGIYFLRQRSRSLPVSSLLLWRHHLPERQRGRRLDRFRGNWLLAVEALALLFLVLAAAGPATDRATELRPLVVVVDASFSMAAGVSPGDTTSAWQEARRALLDELDGATGPHLSVSVVAAGPEPRQLVRGAAPEEVAEHLADWQPTAPGSDLERALEQAREIGGEQARLLVLSDHPPPVPPTDPRLEWWSFGRGVDNLAIVNAVRSRRDEPPGVDPSSGSWVLVEVAHFGRAPTSTTLRIEAWSEARSEPAGGRGESVVLASEVLRLGPGEKVRRRLPVPTGADIELFLPGDALALDDHALLPAGDDPRVKVRLELETDALRRALERVLGATGRVRWVESGAEWVIREHPGTGSPDDVSTHPGEPPPWILDWHVPRDPSAFLGPFLVDRHHPLGHDLDLGGVIWAADTESSTLGPGERAVLRVGNHPLLIDRSLTGGGHHLDLHLDPELSTLEQSPDWPILWWNLLAWRAAERPGVEPVAARLGAPVRWVRPPGEDAEARWQLPGGELRTLEGGGPSFELLAEPVGEHRLEDGERVWRFAVNALAAAESDLRRRGTGRWGRWDDGASTTGDPTASSTREQRPFTWGLVLLALGVLIGHLYWTSEPAAEAVE